MGGHAPGRIHKVILALTVAVFTSFWSLGASADWHYGVGTGLFLLNVDGDIGFDSALAGGPVKAEIDLKPDDVQDLMESAYGLGGFATDGNWMLQFQFAYLKLEDDPAVELPGGNILKATLYQEVTKGEASIGYVMYRGDKLKITPYVGVRFTEHELGRKVSLITGTETLTDSADFSRDWTEARVGATFDVPLAPKWNWSTSLEGSGGSDIKGYQFNTGVAWNFAQHWTTRLHFNYLSVDYENDDPGDSSWYLYDADEFGVGLNIMYTW